MIERAIPMTQGVTPLDVLSDAGTRAGWGIEGLPTDPLSIENGAIMTSAARWALMIDPQLQGIKWIKQKWGDKLKIIQLSKPNYINDVEQCIENGIPLMIEGCKRHRRGAGPGGGAADDQARSKHGDEARRQEVDYDPNFRLYLQTKLSNLHYKPEIVAQTTLVNTAPQRRVWRTSSSLAEKERLTPAGVVNLVRQLGEYVQITKLEDNSCSASPTPRATSSRTSSSSRTSRRPNALRRRLSRR